MRTLDETMIRINDVKALIRAKRYTTQAGSKRLHLRDTSSGSASGDSYNLVIQEYKPFTRDDGVILDWFWNDVEILAKSHDTSMPTVTNKIGGIGAYGPTFDRAEIMAVLS